MPLTGSIEGVLRRDRAVLVAVLAALTAVSWAYIVQMTRDVAPLASGPFAGQRVMTCCGASLWLTFVMWAVMMVGMMLPSAAPMMLTFATVNRRRTQRGGPFVPTWIFLGGYLVAWTAFSAVAAIAQWGLFQRALLDPETMTVAPWMAGPLLLAAGGFQLTPAKRACLRHCRGLLDFLTSQWREGRLGALTMGLRHGLFCIGCCWLLMALLFVVGVMNLLWVAALAAFVIIEKMVPWRRAAVWGGAASCLAAGAALSARALGVAWIL